ncbi:hypothetical protein OIHEL45_19741, partial [Sulfitobacter indolifex HEL-45]
QYMCHVVLADTVDTAHGKAGCATNNGKGHLFRSGNDVRL